MNASSQADPPELSQAVLRQVNARLRQQLEQAELKIRTLFRDGRNFPSCQEIPMAATLGDTISPRLSPMTDAFICANEIA